MTNGQAKMHYSKHRLTASAATTWLRARTRQPMTNGRASLLCSRLSRPDYLNPFKTTPSCRWRMWRQLVKK